MSDGANSSYRVFAAEHPEFVAGIARLRAFRERELGALSALDARERRDRVRKTLRSSRLALLYAYEAIRRLHRLHRASPASIRELAARCNPFAPTYEPVHRLVVPREREMRPASRHRLVQSFGPLKRMHQMLVADVLVAIHPPRADQYLFNGGMPMALEAIEAAFREGFTHAVEVDFVNFYGSLRQHRLAELLRPLPAAVTTNVVWDVTSRRSADDDIAVPRDEGDPSLSGLVGLSLGAASSPIVGEAVIADILGSAQCERVITYADNILVLGRGLSDVEVRAQHLRECAERHEAGSLRPRISRPAAFRDQGAQSGGVYFASQFARAIRHRLDWAPAPEKQARHHVADLVDHMTLDEIDLAERRLAQWRRSYPMWRTGGSFEIARMAELAAARYYVSPQPENLAAARNALVLACLTCGVDRQPEEFAPAWSGKRNEGRRERLLLEAANALPQVGDID